MARRTLLSRLLLVLAGVLTVLALLAGWVRGQLLDGDRYVATSTAVLAEPVVQQATAAYLADALMTAPGLQQALSERLPGPTKPLAGPLTGVVGDAAERGARRALGSGAFQRLWREANALTYRQLERAVKEGDRRAIVLDLRPMLGRLATRLGFGGRVVASLPEGQGVIRILSPEDVSKVGDAARALRASAFVLSTLALLALIGGALLAPTRASGLFGAGAALLVASVLVLAARRTVGNAVIDDLTADGSIATAGRTSWWILTAYLADIAGGVALLGAILLGAGWLGGPSRAAARVRAPLRRGITAQPGLAALVAFLAATGLIVAGALPWSGSPVAAVVYLLGAVAIVLAAREPAGTA
jgi:hypothetical protein